MPLEMSLCRIFYGCRIFYTSSKFFSEANHIIKSFQNFFQVIWGSSWPYIRQNSCYCEKYVKNGVFCKKVGFRRIFYGCRIFCTSSKFFSEANHIIKSLQNFFQVIWGSSWPYIRLNSCYCEKYVKNGIFCKKSDFVEYSTGVEYSGDQEKIFLNPTYDQVFPKKISCQSDQ